MRLVRKKAIENAATAKISPKKVIPGGTTTFFSPERIKKGKGGTTGKIKRISSSTPQRNIGADRLKMTLKNPPRFVRGVPTPLMLDETFKIDPRRASSVSSVDSSFSPESSKRGKAKEVVQGSRTSKVKERRTSGASKCGMKASKSDSPHSSTAGIMMKNELEGDEFSARPSYMSEELEKKVLKSAERMRDRDLSGDYPVPSFVLELIKRHPSLRKMGLRERIDFLCTKWDLLSIAERKVYVRNPLKGIIPEADML